MKNLFSFYYLINIHITHVIIKIYILHFYHQNTDNIQFIYTYLLS